MLAAVALIGPLTWETPCATDVALKKRPKKKAKKKKKEKKKKERKESEKGYTHIHN